ncbi:hypothetical protein Q4604_19305 [Marinovum sp. 1_MG-2023]|nr:hypothetical protein [Marinovum sp. 1_MG-2023]
MGRYIKRAGVAPVRCNLFDPNPGFDEHKILDRQPTSLTANGGIHHAQLTLGSGVDRANSMLGKIPCSAIFQSTLNHLYYLFNAFMAATYLARDSYVNDTVLRNLATPYPISFSESQSIKIWTSVLQSRDCHYPG